MENKPKVILISPGIQSNSEILFEKEGFEILDDSENINNSKTNKQEVINKGSFIVRIKVNIPNYQQLSNKDREELIKILDSNKI